VVPLSVEFLFVCLLVMQHSNIHETTTWHCSIVKMVLVFKYYSWLIKEMVLVS